MRAVRSKIINAAQPIRSMERRLLLDAMARTLEWEIRTKWVVGPHAADLYMRETCPKRDRGGAAPTEPKRAQNEIGWHANQFCGAPCPDRAMRQNESGGESRPRIWA